MANSKVIIVEGAQGAGKTTVTDFIRYSLNYTNLYRLCGTSDSSPAGLTKSITMYENLMNYIKSLENQSINLLFDRTFFTEEIYCRLGLKQFSFTEEFNRLLKKLDEMDFEIYYITLFLKDTSIFTNRLKRDGKVSPDYLKFSSQNSILQQNEYLNLAEEIKNKTKNIHVVNIATDKGIEVVKEQIKDVLNF